MSSHILEGESFFVLNALDELIEGKKVEINPERVNNSFSLIKNVDYYVYIDPSREVIENIKIKNYILCFLDKNLDLRLDYVRRVKQESKFVSFDPIPATDFNSLKGLFPKFKEPNNFLPCKNMPLKYNGAKVNYEWFDLNLICDIYSLGDLQIFPLLFDSYFDIWKFSDGLWAASKSCIEQIKYIDEKNFEDYFNRIRETSRDYIEVLQTGARNFYEHKRALPTTVITNEFRFNKVIEKLKNIKSGEALNMISGFDSCLKNVRLGSSPKIEMLNLFFNFKKNVLR